MAARVSVIMCTHNPHPHRLTRALDALERQALPRDQWEFIVVDNRSDTPVSAAILPRGLDGAKIVCEPELGLTPARLAGVASASADLLVFVDDDNVLARDYLENALALFDAEPTTGAAGGVIEAEFESEPPAWARPYLGLLGIRDFGDRPMRALVYGMVGPWEPIGAGLVIRKRIAEHYAWIARDPLRRSLDRRGTSLGSCGDTDLVRCAPEMGYFMAYAPQLRLTHLIPASRLRLRYLVRLSRALKRTGILLDRVRAAESPASIPGWKAWLRVVPESIRQFTPSWRHWLLRMAAVVGEIEARNQSLLHESRP
jgi:glycosyltransferase involved in cell wall biosynthesis